MFYYMYFVLSILLLFNPLLSFLLLLFLSTQCNSILITSPPFSLQNALNKALLDDMKSNRERITDPVLAVEVVQRESIYGYHGNQSSQFLRLTLALPRLIPAAKRLLGEGKVFVPSLGTPVYEAYESNIDFEIRFVLQVLGPIPGVKNSAG